MSAGHRRLPAVNALVDAAEAAGLLEDHPRQVVVDAVRASLSAARESGEGEPTDGWMADVTRRATRRTRLSLTRVVNATGVILHTNLGRAPLAPVARQAAAGAFGYSSLEYDLATGDRGSRQDHVRDLLRQLTGAEDAVVVTNAAAAVLLLLNTLAREGETIVSRGELVEIGGSFRIPDILARSNSALVEVGTTNRTRLDDYRHAATTDTRLLLKVHRSNFTMSGFVAETSVSELVALGRELDVPVVHDVGSGLLMDLSHWGLSGEPLVKPSVEAGATVAFSGDKLVGGPQAGIVVGPREVVARAAQNPLARALRPDKSTMAALEATLALYLDPDNAIAEVPVLSMLTSDPSTLKRRARRLARRIEGGRTIPGVSTVGGGAFPGSELPTTLVAVPTESADVLLERLRQHDPPVIARTVDDLVVFDVRTLLDDEFALVAEAVTQAKGGIV